MSSSSSSQYSSQDGGHSKDGDGGVLLIRMSNYIMNSIIIIDVIG